MLNWAPLRRGSVRRAVARDRDSAGRKAEGQSQGGFRYADAGRCARGRVSQGVVFSQRRLVDRQIEEGGPLPVREDGSTGHGRFSSGKIVNMAGDQASRSRCPGSLRVPPACR